MLDLRSDEQLMLAAADGDDDAFGALTLRLRGMVCRFLHHLGCDAATAEDLAQDTLLRLWASREAYEARGTLRAYVLTIAKNRWLSWVRDCGGPQLWPQVQDEALDRLLFAQDRVSRSLEGRLLDRYRAERIRSAIAALPERQRLVFALAHLHDMPYAEIAQLLGIAEGTVKSRMHRAVAGLRRELMGEFPRQPGEGR